MFYKWPIIWPPQTHKQGVLQVAYNLSTAGRQTRCSTSGLVEKTQSDHHRQKSCSTSGLVERKKKTIWPPQADKQGVLQVAYNLYTTTDRQTGCSTSVLHSDHPRQTRQDVLTYRLALAGGLVLGAVHPGDGHLLAHIGRSQLFPGRGQSLAVATPVHSRITQCCNTAATPVHSRNTVNTPVQSRITQCCNTAATPVHSRITQCYKIADTPVHSRTTQCYNTAATPVHSRITQCYNTVDTPVHSRITQ